MKIANMDGLPLGDTENPELIVTPRGGVPAVIDTPDHLKRAARALKKGRAPVALDVERAQGFRYGNDPYLVQIRREDVGTYLIDTHALTDLTILNEGLKETWLLHDAAQDLPNLRQLGLEPPLLFDTEIAARLIGLERFGLAAVCEQVLGLGLVKDHQASDWSLRPLPKDWLRYALNSLPSCIAGSRTVWINSTAGSGPSKNARISLRFPRRSRRRRSGVPFLGLGRSAIAVVSVSLKPCGGLARRSHRTSTSLQAASYVMLLLFERRWYPRAIGAPFCRSMSSAPPLPAPTPISGYEQSLG